VNGEVLYQTNEQTEKGEDGIQEMGLRDSAKQMATRIARGSGHQWLVSIIQATWEAKIRGIKV
jgi:hypothetical protein